MLHIPQSERRPHAGLTDKLTFYVQRQGDDTTPLTVHELETLRNVSAIPRFEQLVEDMNSRMARLEEKIDSGLVERTPVERDLADITDPHELLDQSRKRITGEK